MNKIINCEACGREIEVGLKVSRAKCAACKEKTAADLKKKKDSEYREVEPTICKVCGKSFNYDWRKDWKTRKKKKAEFCSETCARKYSSDQAFLKYQNSSKRVKCLSCGKEFEVDFHVDPKIFLCKECKVEKYGKHSLSKTGSLKNRSIYSLGRTCKYCDKPIRNNNKTGLCEDCLRHTEEGKQILSCLAVERMQEGSIKSWSPRNIIPYSEQYWKEVLNNEGISYETNYKVLSYFLDFFIKKGDILIDLEIDGKQHNWLDNMKHDTLRNYKIGKLGYKVYRNSWKGVKTGGMKKKVSDFLKWYRAL